MYQQLLDQCSKAQATLIAVSKTKPISAIQELYDLGQRDFGENRVQELVDKQATLPKDIRWHLIGHLQKNKVKHIAPFVHLIHAVDSEALLKTIQKEAQKNDRVIDILIQVKIAAEDTKFGLTPNDAKTLISEVIADPDMYPNINIIGLMGMATFTDDHEQIKDEFKSLIQLQKRCEKELNISLPEVSMGMSGDYKIALSVGSTMLRVGSLLFGSRT